MNPSELYIGLEDPKVLHKNLLEGQKDVINALKRFELIHELRKQKTREFLKLRSLINQCSHILIELRIVMPHVEGHHARVKDSEPKQKALTEKDDAELARLDKELNDIESRLRQL